MTFVYMIICMPSGRRYIGITDNLRRRWNDHRAAAVRGDSPNVLLGRSIRKYGPQAFTMVPIYEAASRREAEAVERALIATHRTLAPHGMNMTCGGEGTVGFRKPHSESTKRKIGRAHKGKFVHPEVGAKISAANRGRKCSDQARINMAAAQIGRRHRRESVEKVAAAKREYWAQWRADHPRPTTVKVSGQTGIYWNVRRQQWEIELQIAGKKHRATRCRDLDEAIARRDVLRARVLAGIHT